MKLQYFCPKVKSSFGNMGREFSLENKRSFLLHKKTDFEYVYFTLFEIS